jgi:hypothetical protein
MKLSFTGSQLGMTARQKDSAHFYLLATEPTVVIHGGCIGADWEFDGIAANLGIPRIVFPSDSPTKSVPIERYRLEHQGRNGSRIAFMTPMPALKRNPLIVDEGEQLLAAPAQPSMILRSGTWTTVRYAYRVKKHVEILRPY